MDDLLYRLARRCEALLNAYLARLRAQTPWLVDRVVGYQQKFAIWAADYHLFSPNGQSLDSRLRDHADIQQLVVRLLDILRRTLLQLERACEGCEAGEGSEPDSPSSRSSDDARHDKALSFLDFTLTRLHKLGPTIRLSCRRPKYVNIQTLASRAPPFAVVSQLVVQHLYPSAQQSLQRHLGKAVADRYAAMLSARQQPAGPRQPRTEDLGSTPTTEGNRPEERPDPPDDGTSSIQFSQCNYPPLSTHQQRGISIACEWCGKMIEAQGLTETDWRRHVDEDLKPYLCISDTCSEAHPAFPALAPWLTHMRAHDRLWHRKVLPTARWMYPAYGDDRDGYTRSEDLGHHPVEAHEDVVAREELQPAPRRRPVERGPRLWNECPLCRLVVEEVEHPDERDQMERAYQACEASHEASCATKHTDPKRHGQLAEGLSTSDSSAKVPRTPSSPNGAEAMALHIAAHLQTLMLLTIRLASLYDHRGQDGPTDADSIAANAGASDLVLSTEPDSEPTTNSVLDDESVETRDATKEARKAADARQDDGAVPDADVDFDGIPRRHDGLRAEEDTFLQGLIKSGAFQTHPQKPVQRRYPPKKRKRNGEPAPAGDALIWAMVGLSGLAHRVRGYPYPYRPGGKGERTLSL